MVRTLCIALVGLVLCICGSSAQAFLVDNGDNLFYDTDLDITWYVQSNRTGMSWADAKSWAENLVIGGVTGWRLPSALNTGGSGPCYGYGCTNSEMGHLFYVELGNSGGFPPSEPINTGPFTDIGLYDLYWSDTESVEYPDEAWVFWFYDGKQYMNLKTHGSAYALAVHEGNIHTPIPGAVFLLGSGLAGIAAMRNRLKRT